MIMYGCVSYKDAVVKSPEFILKKGESVVYEKYSGGKHIRKERSYFPVLYEDEFFIIVNKTSGVNYASKTCGKGKSIFDLTLSYLKRKYGNQQSLFLIHSMDNQESGLCVFARSKHAQMKMNEQWNEMELGYYAILQNDLKHKNETFVFEREEKSFKVAYQFIEAIDYFDIPCCLVDVFGFGISGMDCRQAFAQKDNPIVADLTYGSKEFANNYLKLCCHSMKFRHPYTQKSIKITMNPPKGFNIINPPYRK
jgi:23S rRNA pseudouridine1911/1915/1917 synthase